MKILLRAYSRKIKIATALVVLMLLVAANVQAQKFGVKTNLLYGVAAQAPNIGVEIALGKKSTFEFEGGFNAWNDDEKKPNQEKMAHWLVVPEYRYWFCQKFNGHFLGVHALGGGYDVAKKDMPLLFEKKFRYDGWIAGAGISYGYHWMLAKRWGMEFNLGLGFAYLKYDKYPCPTCEVTEGKFEKTYFGPTKGGISLIYIIK